MHYIYNAAQAAAFKALDFLGNEKRDEELDIVQRNNPQLLCIFDSW